ncbi:sodium-translocating pyrophosphatase [Chryseobacterium indologenes]|uniref:sodium-translocating pyrophosphatase n=1 Tax=Chryseobacterium indologenes TaxID=253 RepID=UPI0003E0620D|nr:sodium-translocating pyrophosphatase [Chryseobacterium indologenes]QPQ51161.1 sodium-translocating pyrophosphatase [Chryseobacterium indologenes]TLX24536.1 sodium-translocating pyrophosphatase [Chryseobacterium indologenes]SFK02195.1 K(+)-stimulated pyrophosphate-energized sodium pump [Chryseobacterium indologenes]SUX49539.1 Putative K(+)-stimulated pyrophosphate-energized sodium pump [Chryseobacterium indologenes]GAE65658.1 pyrophosphate-energized proton pump [Chryseobacterium indologenes 
MDLFVLVPIFGVIALLYTFLQSNWVNKQNAGNEKMKIISGHIADGAMAFLKAEYKILMYFVVVVAILLAVMGSSNANSHWSIGIAFAVGAVFSALAGFIGMKIATKANVRTAEAARTSLSKALKVSFTGGSVMGMGVAGLAVLGLGALFLIIKQIFAPDATVDSHEMERTIEILTGFSLGAESIALFARVGGGIYTKAADVGADLVGKVEAGIPEDDPRNPATIADNVGDNVGDVAGMGADLFGSYVATVLATMVLGRETVSDDSFGGFAPILLPMLIAGTGIIFSMIGTLFVRINDNEGSSTSSVQNALNLGNWGSIIITAIASYFLVTYILPEKMVLRGHEFTKMGVFGAIMVGLVVGTLMSIITEYYTAMGKRPVSSIVRQSSTGHATNIIGGLSVGMESTLLPIIVLAGGIYGSYLCAGLYGVAIAAAGMMATTAMQLAIDAFGPIADNAGGIAEMSELPKEVREKTDILDAVGNTTAATGKGFAIASAALTALALFAAFVGIAGIDGIDIYRADVLAGLFVGGMIPFIFSSLAITAVGQAAMAMVEEVRRQFREIPGILEGKAQPEYEKCVAISTDASIRKMMLPGAIAIISPLLIGFIFGPEVLGGFLAGATVCGVLMGMFQNNAGGAWDNAKKSFEKGVDINGQTYYKGSEPHKASVTGDTVGDPFKDTSGPSMNILIKLMSIVSLVIAPTLAVLHKDKIEANRKAKIEALTGVSADHSATGNVDQSVLPLNPAEIKGHLNENGDFVYETGSIQKLKLKGGKTIAIGDGSQIYQLYKSIDQKDKTIVDPNKWYTIENLYFETGSSDLKPGYEMQLNNLAEILNAYPDLKIKLGGYTDNSGNEESNQQLSNLRAQTAKLKLLELGVSADRVEAEGYGSQHPICEANDTDECKAKNRRIDVRVLAL